MAKVFKSKIFLGIICLILAAAIAFLVWYLFGLQKTYASQLKNKLLGGNKP